MQAREATEIAPIREPVLRGHQFVAALWFPVAWFDEKTRAARLIACWRPGATALRFPQGDLLCFSTPIEENSDDLPGWSLRQESGALCSAPLTDTERAIGRDGDVWLVMGAEVTTLHRRDARPLDPSEWLAIDELSLHDTYDCKVAPPAPEVLDLEARPLRDVLGKDVPPASQEQTDFLAAIRRLQKENPKGVPTAGRGRETESEVRGITALLILLVLIVIVVGLVVASITSPGIHFGWVLFAALIIRLIFLAVRDEEGGVQTRTVAQPASKPVATPEPPLKARRGLASPQRWRRWLALIAMTTQLSRLLGRAHARHMRKLLDYFEDGNLAEALRHAIPLGGMRDSLGQGFGMPGRRSNLDLSGTLGPAISVNFGDELHERLRQLYRQAFEKLDREGRYAEAVFVLAELLNDRKEALDYLEKHKRFEQAAELALGWDMAPDVIVRLLCLAGDWRRAVAVARRDNAFATAVAQLEKRWPDAARRLREEWGNALVQQGDWIGAVDAVWPVESLRPKATQWLLTAEAAGGRLALRALVQRAVVLPDTLDRYAKDLLELQRDRSAWRDRTTMAEALMNIGKTPATKHLALLIAPAVLADHAQGLGRFNQRVLGDFVKSSGDLLLQVDLPDTEWPAVQAVPASARTESLNLEAPEAGLHAIFDAVPLEDDRYLVALGEAGACVVDATGRVRSRFATPAQQLVLAHSRQVALLLARRESQWRVSRLDLAQKTVIDLGMIEFERCGSQFDGLHWTVAQGKRLRVLDTQDSLRQVVWQVADLPGPVYAMSTSPTLEQLMLEVAGDAREFWSYRLPQRQLTARNDLTQEKSGWFLLNPAGGAVRIDKDEIEEQHLSLRWFSGGRVSEARIPAASRETSALWVAGEWLVVCTREEPGYVVRWLLLSSGVECARVLWPDAPFVRACNDEWLVFDECGRLLSFNVSSSHWQSLSLR